MNTACKVASGIQELHAATIMLVTYCWDNNLNFIKWRRNLKIWVPYAIHIVIKAYPTIPLSGRSNPCDGTFNTNRGTVHLNQSSKITSYQEVDGRICWIRINYGSGRPKTYRNTGCFFCCLLETTEERAGAGRIQTGNQVLWIRIKSSRIQTYDILFTIAKVESLTAKPNEHPKFANHRFLCEVYLVAPSNCKVDETTPKIKPRERRNTMLRLATQHLTQVASDAFLESLRLNQKSSSQQQLLQPQLL